MKELTTNQVIIAIGAGGVGKTTVASALGLYFAKRGQKTLVITVDPARRLLDAMAVKTKTDEPSRVVLDGLVDNAVFGGELSVFMPNLKKEWADFLASAIKEGEVRREISTNPFYQYMAEGMPGAFEIICSHVLFRLIATERYDKIILDTPPSSHSISFFDVPQNIARVLEQGVFRSLMNRRHSMLMKLTKKLAFLSGGILENTFERLIGSHFLSELIDFALTIDALYEPMLTRVKAMDALLKNPSTKYALIVRPTAASIKDSMYLKSALTNRGIRLSQIVFNQVMPELDSDEIVKELAALPHDTAALRRIEALVALYEKEVTLEKDLLKQAQKQFKNIDQRFLYMTEATLSRSALLNRLVADLDLRGNS